MTVQIHKGGEYLSLPLSLCAERVVRFHAQWLRDNALDSKTRSSSNGQKLITLADQAAEPKLDHAEIVGQQLAVVIDGQSYSFPLAWLLQNAYDRQEVTEREQELGWLSSDCIVWNRADLEETLSRTQGEQQQRESAGTLVADFDQLLADDRCLHDWLQSFHQRGFGIVRGFAKKDSEAIVRVVERFGTVRETNYGRVFDVRSELNPTNLAFTGLGLEVHSDNPYRDPVPTIQLLACMANSAEGGDSIVVDGFAAAKALQQQDQEAFELLASYPVDFRYAGGHDVDLSCQKPMIELSADGELSAIRFNNRSAAPITRVPFAEMPRFYRAMRLFATLLNDPKLQFQFKLQEGELFMVDNRRVLHGRAEVVGEGQRWLRGCYADVDALQSKLRVLKRKLNVTELGERIFSGATATTAATANTGDSKGIVAKIEAIFRDKADHNYLGEACTMTSHMLQGAWLAEKSGADDELIAAALLHDIGHFANEFTRKALDRGVDGHHEDVGAEIIAGHFPERVVSAVRNHVAAKRYLCATDPSYHDQLSAASKATLELQGGPMTAAEVAAFEQIPFYGDAVKVRLWDDEGKLPEDQQADLPTFAHYKPLLQRLASQS